MAGRLRFALTRAKAQASVTSDQVAALGWVGCEMVDRLEQSVAAGIAANAPDLAAMAHENEGRNAVQPVLQGAVASPAEPVSIV